MIRTTRAFLVITMIVWSVITTGVLAADTAAVDAPRVISVNSGEMAAALQSLAKQTGVEFFYSNEQLKGVQTKGVHGTFTAKEAVGKLLEGTGLTLSVHESGALLISPRDQPHAGRAVEGGLRLAQAESRKEESGEVTNQNPPTNSDKESADQKIDKGVKLEEVVVTGTNIRSAGPTGSPVQIFDREAIARSGYGSVEAFMKSLPVNSAVIGANTSFVRASINSGNSGYGNAVNLRGLGSDATLVLLDGQRIAPGGFNGALVDVSFIPVSLIERIEVLTDGASAIYGSDAVAGVVNYILRDDFEGAESTARLANATRGSYEEINLSQTFGTRWSGGNGVLAMNYAWNPNLRASDRSYSESVGAVDLVPQVQTKSVFGSIAHSPNGVLDLRATALYSDRKVVQKELSLGTPLTGDADTTQLATSLSGNIKFSGDWAALAIASYSRNDTVLGTVFGKEDSAATSTTLGLKFDGPIGIWTGSASRLAVGAEYRREKFKRFGTGDFALAQAAIARERDVKAVYTELSVPIVTDANARKGLRRLALTAAARYEKYSDFGDTLDPKLGLLWAPSDSLNIRGTIGTSFKAPHLTDLYGGGSSILLNADDPNSLTGSSPTLIVFGSNADLDTESSLAWTTGFDWTPTWLTNLRIGLTYFDVSYKDRIAPPSDPDLFSFISRPQLYSPFIIRTPLAAVIDEYLANYPVFNLTEIPDFGPVRSISEIAVIGDERLANLAATDLNGIDFDAHFFFSASECDWTLSLLGTYLLTKETRLVSGLPAVVELDRLFSPPNLRLVASASVRRNRLSANGSLNYADSYKNTLGITPAGVSSWTTADVQVRYDFSSNGAASFLALSVNNVFDSSPPHVVQNGLEADRQFGYDPVNASPLGRLISLQFTYRW